MSAGRILIVHYTPPGVVGGVERIIEQHVGLFRERGYSVDVVAGRAGPAGKVQVIPEMDAALAENSAVEEELAAGVVSPTFHALRLSILNSLEPLFRGVDIVVVHNAFTLHFNVPLTAALWQLAGMRRPDSVLAWCHDLAWVNPLYVPALHGGYPWDLLRRPAPGVQYVTVSAERGQELLGLWGGYGGDVRVVPNGVDVGAFLRLSAPIQDLVERHRLFDRDIVLLLPVRITRRKNIQLGMRAVRALKDRGIDVAFLISGPQAPHHPGKSHEYLEQLLALRRELSLEKDVVFLAEDVGHSLDEAQVTELYAVADALLFPSESEGFGLPILEAGLARMPAVVSEIPIFAEVGGEDLWTFGLKDEADRIAGEIVKALDNRPSRLRRKVLREYRWEAVFERHILPLIETQSDAPLLQES